ncbi:phosphate ABC transporter substrate-binding protein [Pseudomonas guariconensis]|uniref:phosphate ABC transporter substrate-binding protein n=1 Tax=Pseudomonas guariconensis TaxID=1288410 RepID=UPI0018AB8207|nr:phosphate ABC transporter substrate-binding protein [Pseudomonas guariconensis]MBF8723175.1 phosphate ABC transporter substrate-binding protein [Pseudomonas guariconensis]MBF8794177.1 phosphate ABC transporter substrate-binding protein [Pseudomonas monteilii]
MKPLITAVFAAALATACTLARAEVAVIVNASASAAPSQAEVANIFLGKNTSLKGLDQKGWNTTKERFYSALTNKNESQLKSYWSGLVFTGKGQPLQSVEDDAAVIARVGSESNAIGYVDTSAVNDKVKVLFTLP